MYRFLGQLVNGKVGTAEIRFRKYWIVQWFQVILNPLNQPFITWYLSPSYVYYDMGNRPLSLHKQTCTYVEILNTYFIKATEGVIQDN